MSNCVCMDTNTSRPKRSNTPANMPDASDTGMRLRLRSNTPLKPATAINMADSTNAPMASAYGTPVLLAISMAAPGVDHAVTTGMR